MEAGQRVTIDPSNFRPRALLRRKLAGPPSDVVRASDPAQRLADRDSVLLEWVGKGGWAVLDQGLFAGGNFLMNIFLARWLPATDYGAFTFSYSLFLLLAALHTGAITEPMLVLGSGKFRQAFLEYFGLLLNGHWLLTTIIAVTLGFAAAGSWFMGNTETAQFLLCLAMALPFMLFLWLVRRAFYVVGQPRLSASLTAAHIFSLLLGLYTLYHLSNLSKYTAFIVLGVSALIAGLIFLPLLKHESLGQSTSTLRFVESQLSRNFDAKNRLTSVAYNSGFMVLRLHLKYAKWACLANLTTWVSANVHYFVLASRGSLHSVAAMKVIDNIFVGYWQFLTALSSILLSVLASKMENHPETLSSYLTKIALILVFFSIVFYSVVVLFGDKLIYLIFGARYRQYANLLPVYGLMLVPESVSVAVLLAFRAMIRTDLVFASHLILSVSLVIVFVIVSSFGLSGIIWGRVATSYVIMPTFVVIYLKAASKLQLACKTA